MLFDNNSLSATPYHPMSEGSLFGCPLLLKPACRKPDNLQEHFFRLICQLAPDCTWCLAAKLSMFSATDTCSRLLR